MIRSGSNHRKAFAILVEDINEFEFEDRKKIQELVSELLRKQLDKNELVTALSERAPIILDKLLAQYENHDYAPFVGEYLRLFTQFPLLLKAWCRMSRIQNLLHVILNFDFNIQSDAVETTMFLLMADRPSDDNWAKFIIENQEQLTEVFFELYEEIAGDEDQLPEKNNGGDDEAQCNFFALKELMKLQYQMLTKRGECFEAVVHNWSNDKRRLRQIMELSEFEDDGLIYECILQLSLFILRPERSPEIIQILVRNK